MPVAHGKWHLHMRVCGLQSPHEAEMKWITKYLFRLQAIRSKKMRRYMLSALPFWTFDSTLGALRSTSLPRTWLRASQMVSYPRVVAFIALVCGLQNACYEARGIGLFDSDRYYAIPPQNPPVI